MLWFLVISALLQVLDLAEGRYAAANGGARISKIIERKVLNALRRDIAQHNADMEVRQQQQQGGRPRPFVTLTYAQSVDGSIARADKTKLRLSGPEAHAMTHSLRHLHDVILVGAGTIKADDPKLTVRYWPGEGSPPGRSPRPVILHTGVSVPLSTRVRNAIVFTTFQDVRTQRWLSECARSAQRGVGLGSSDHLLVQCSVGSDGRCDIGDCLERLYEMGYRSVMVEGGAEVISSFLRGGFVDKVVITVAPLLLGGYQALVPARVDAPAVRFRSLRYLKLGGDLVLIGEALRPRIRQRRARAEDAAPGLATTTAAPGLAPDTPQSELA